MLNESASVPTGTKTRLPKMSLLRILRAKNGRGSYILNTRLAYARADKLGRRAR